jgi:hypothetical protein
MADQIGRGAAEPIELAGASLPDHDQTRLFSLCGLDEATARVPPLYDGLMGDSEAAEHAARVPPRSESGPSFYGLPF